MLGHKGTIKILYNDSKMDGFCLSDAARYRYKEKTGKRVGRDDPVDREDPVLIEIVENMGKSASGQYSDIKICEIDAIFSGFYEITDYEGLETIKFHIDKVIIHKLQKLQKIDMKKLSHVESIGLLAELSKLATLIELS